MFRMVDWTLDNSVHLHLVAHSRKGERDRGAPEAEDIKAAMEIGANASNILTVWRNRRFEENIRTADSDDLRRSFEEMPGVILNVAKQRHGDFEGKVGLWFDQASFRYRSSHDQSGWDRSYLPRDGPFAQFSDVDRALVSEVHGKRAGWSRILSAVAAKVVDALSGQPADSCSRIPRTGRNWGRAEGQRPCCRGPARRCR